MMYADYILTGDGIFDSVSNEPFAGFVAVKANKIIEIGKETSDWKHLADEKTKVINCDGKLIMPGMIDAHMHFFDGIFQNSKFMCRDLFECKSAQECVDVIKKFADEHKDYDRIVGMGWFIPEWDDKTLPNKKMLDEIIPDKPVYLMCETGHSFWLNSKALEQCEIDPNRKLLFGSIEKDENGEANGVMHELDACALPAVKAQTLPEDEREKLISDFIKVLAKNGITSTTDMAVVPQAPPITDDLKVVADMERRGVLNVRLNIYPALGTDEKLNSVKEYKQAFTSDKLRVGGLKAFIDGVMGNYTALLKKPYFDKPELIGESFYPHEYYIKQIEAANRAGFGVKLHCCGDRAIAWALDAYEHSNKVNKNENIRNSIEHVEIVDSDILERFVENNVTATMQPLHLMYEGQLFNNILGSERTRYQYAVNSVLSAGINVAFSSDYPVADFNPMVNVYFATTRCTLEGEPIEIDSKEKITIADALKAYTYGSAYCVNMENKLGTLEKDKLADIVVLDKNIFNVDSKEIIDTQASLTMVDGVITLNELS